MAENVTTSPQEDPLLKQSLGGHLVFWSALLIVCVIWSGWDEFVHKRPWKAYQKAFVEAYDKVLANEHAKQQKREAAAYASDEYEAYQRVIDEEGARTAPELKRIDDRTRLIGRQLDAINDVVKFPKGEIGMLVNRIEHAGGRAKERLQARLEEVETKRRYVVDLPQPGGAVKELSGTYKELVAKTEELKAERVRLGSERADIDRKRSAAFKAQQDWLALNMPGLKLDAITGLRRELDTFEVEIKQVHVPDVDLVDRCESCHAGIRSEVPITRDALAKAGVEDEAMRNMFVSHPRPTPLDGVRDMLEVHPPSQFGCSPCHNGNGTGTISAHLAHGLNKHWLWKLYDRENFEAGCQQCHEGAIYNEGADVLNHGREMFWQRACWACHKREGFNREPEDLQEVATAMQANRTKLEDKLKEKRDVDAILNDENTPVETVEKAIERANALTVEFAQVQTEYDALRSEQRHLNFERKRQGPNLKEIKAKLKREWLVPWLDDPRAFRPDTKMPEFRLNAQQIEAIAAFLWNRALDVEIAKQPAGNAERGRELFEKRGCMGCHKLSVDHGDAGGVFAADLSRVGEKVHYDYLVRWIHDPRVRLAPYSEAKKEKDGDGDVTVADYRAAGKEPVWDRQHTECPTTGEEMIVENQTVMPSLRLSWEDARDVASFLMTKKTDKEYGDAGFSLAPAAEQLAYGEKLVKHFGCAGCHEIKGLEEEGPIGTELTKEGSKPLERLDFGLLTYDVKRKKDIDGDGVHDKYDHKTFFMQKLRQPEIWDHGKDKSEFEALRMPNFGLSYDDRVALTTFLLGSVDSRFPGRFYYEPEGPAKDIQKGWWVVKKYNCQGCHQFLPTGKPRIQTLDWFAGENVVEAPPALVGQGFRTNPKWLGKFLANPSLTGDPAKQNRNGVRQYLQVRMPSFKLTDREVQLLVRFFAALADQPLPQVEPPIAPLPPDGIAAAKAAFENQVCLKCHITDGPLTPQVIAPSFLISGERLTKDWMTRWLLDPGQLIPGTKMPSGLFKRDGGRWVFSNDPKDWPQALRDWKGDHIDLLVRYMRQYNEVNAEGQ